MKSKAVILIVVLVTLISCCPFASAEVAKPYASAQLSSYGAALAQGNATGEIEISYIVNGVGIVNTIGVSQIDIYQANGTLITTIYGTTVNGLVVLSSDGHSGTRTYTGTPGVSYYAEVTVFGINSAGSTTRTITTNTVTAPY